MRSALETWLGYGWQNPHIFVIFFVKSSPSDYNVQTVVKKRATDRSINMK